MSTGIARDSRESRGGCRRQIDSGGAFQAGKAKRLERRVLVERPGGRAEKTEAPVPAAEHQDLVEYPEGEQGHQDYQQGEKYDKFFNHRASGSQTDLKREKASYL